MRVARSFAFVDLSGFTAHTEQHGDEEAVATLAVFRATLREICSAHAISGNGHPVPSAGGPGAAGPTHFCSESCLETWRGRNPALSPD